MANSTARMLLKNGKSFPQLLRSRLVSQSNVNICIKEQQLFQSLINPTQKIFGQKPILGDGFNFVDLKDHALCTEQRKTPTIETARGRRQVSDVDDDDDDDDGDGDDDAYDGDDIGDFDDDDDDDEDVDDPGVRTR